jgi:hypothetical protein
VGALEMAKLERSRHKKATEKLNELDKTLEENKDKVDVYKRAFSKAKTVDDLIILRRQIRDIQGEIATINHRAESIKPYASELRRAEVNAAIDMNRNILEKMIKQNETLKMEREKRRNILEKRDSRRRKKEKIKN